MPKSVAKRNAMKIPTRISGAYSGGELVALRMRDRIAYLIKPTGKVDPQRRWVWDFPFWLAINDGFGNVAHRYYVEKALAAGFHVAGVDVGPSCGSPAAAEVCQEFYEELVSKHGLHKRARVLAHSHGGLIAYGWAFRHPNCVDRIAGMCPATDFRTYPTLPNVVTGATKGLDYGLSLEEFDRRAGEFNPIENLAPLAKAGAKILHIHGDEDTLVPTRHNSTDLAATARSSGRCRGEGTDWIARHPDVLARHAAAGGVAEFEHRFQGGADAAGPDIAADDDVSRPTREDIIVDVSFSADLPIHGEGQLDAVGLCRLRVRFRLDELRDMAADHEGAQLRPSPTARDPPRLRSDRSVGTDFQLRVPLLGIGDGVGVER